MNPGHLRHEVTIQTITRVQTPTGTSESYATVGKIPCLVKEVDANIEVQWAQQSVIITHQVVFRSEAASLLYMAEQLLWWDPVNQALYTLKMRSGVKRFQTASSPLSYINVEQELQAIE